jgi:hypothetical protein
MPQFLDSTGGSLGALEGALRGGTSGNNPTTSAINNALNNNSNLNSFQQNGFILAPIPNADGSGLPSSKVPSQRQSVTKRSVMHWFVPEVGIVNMYINPQSVRYNHAKLIQKERTKGGYSLQYWGEELTTLAITGNTGSSGVEGLNVLEEIYRSEQLTFDPLALSLAANQSVSGLNDIVNNAAQNLGGLGGSILSSTSGVLGLDPSTANIVPRNIPTLASLAYGIELYYMGWVFRGYFNSFSATESTDMLGMFSYDIQFTVTQRRGYRYNFMPHHRSAIDGPSNNSEIGGIPLSFANLQNNSTPIRNQTANPVPLNGILV